MVSDGVNIQEVGIGSEGDNLTAIGGALSWEAHVAGDVLAANLVMANSTTIGDIHSLHQQLVQVLQVVQQLQIMKLIFQVLLVGVPTPRICRLIREIVSWTFN